jgi:hypothetical protein
LSVSPPGHCPPRWSTDCPATDIRALYDRAGFRHVGDTEVVFIARAGGRVLGFVEIDTAVPAPDAMPAR